MPAAAQNWIGLLKNTPAENFNEEDLKLFLEASRKALNDTPVGGTEKWQNPVTGSGGEVKVVKTPPLAPVASDHYPVMVTVKADQ